VGGDFVLANERVGRHERQAVFERLCHQQPVERIAMQQRQRLQRMLADQDGK
jgi:hypothetical protein